MSFHPSTNYKFIEIQTDIYEEISESNGGKKFIKECTKPNKQADAVCFAVAAQFSLGHENNPDTFSHIKSFKEELKAEALKAYHQLKMMLIMYDFDPNITNNSDLSPAEKKRERLLLFMDSLCKEYNALLDSGYADKTPEQQEKDSRFFKMGVFTFFCELCNFGIEDRGKYIIYTQIINTLKEKYAGSPAVEFISEKINSLPLSASSLPKLYHDIMALDLSTTPNS